MKRFLFAPVAMFLALSLFWAGLARAQSAEDVVWVQIEAQPSLAEATDRARAYETLLDDVNGFSLGGGWYGIAVGPYSRADAELVLRSYVRDGLVPRDSFIQQSSRFRQQFWPVGANVLETGQTDAPAGVTPEGEAETSTGRPKAKRLSLRLKLRLRSKPSPPLNLQNRMRPRQRRAAPSNPSRVKSAKTFRSLCNGLAFTTQQLMVLLAGAPARLWGRGRPRTVMTKQAC